MSENIKWVGGFILGCVLITALVFHMENKSHYDYNIELVAINNSTQTSGNFFLGCGSIGEDAVFYFYTKSDQGQIKLQDKPAWACVIYEDITDGQTPYVRLYANWKSYCDGNAEFHVPPNSVLRTFTLDVKGVGR